jgi:uncharacterized damage-inducible protein DinB
MTHPHEIDTLREHLERYRAVSLHALDLVPEDKVGWRLAEGLRTIGEIYLHLGQVESFYINGLCGGRWDYGVFNLPAAAQTTSSLRDELARWREATVRELCTLDPARLVTTQTVPGVPVSWPLRSWLWYLVEHEVHHKAQIGLYLFQLGIEAPFFAYPLPPGIRPDKRPLQSQGGII